MNHDSFFYNVSKDRNPRSRRPKFRKNDVFKNSSVGNHHRSISNQFRPSMNYLTPLFSDNFQQSLDVTVNDVGFNSL